MTDRPQTKEWSITIWASEELLGQIDQHLAQLAVQHAPGRFSRQGWLLSLVRRELATATPEGAALASHRARLAEAATVEGGQP